MLDSHAFRCGSASASRHDLSPLPPGAQSPNYEHVKHAQTWIDAYPGAISYACPGLLEKEVEIAFKETVGLNNSTPTGWPEQVCRQAVW